MNLSKANQQAFESALEDFYKDQSPQNLYLPIQYFWIWEERNTSFIDFDGR